MRLARFLPVLLLPACAEPARIPGPAFEILDADHNAGNPHFHWLAPLVSRARAGGTFDATLAPVVRIVGLEDGVVVAEYTTETGPGSETVRVVTEEEHYVVNWHTDRFALSPDITYRITVLVDGVALGHADVDVVTGGAGLRNVDREQFVALKNGRTLPIKFRIEEGAVPGPTEPSIEPTSGFAGSPFTIVDPQGRMQPGDVVVFFPAGTDPAAGVAADNVVVSADGTTVTGTVPVAATGGPNEVSVTPAVGTSGRFASLLFEVTA